jgi:predicted nucleotide-binding protein
MKPRLFIGSSTEALKTAYAVQESLEHDVLCTVWTQGIFQLSGNALDNLIDAVHCHDFAIFVFQPDDISQVRDVMVRTVRDNVLFELGMFIGVLGKDRVFFLVPKGSECCGLLEMDTLIRVIR